MERFQIKPVVHFGQDALTALGELKGRRVLVITDDFLARSPLMERLKAALEGCTLTVFDRVEPDPSLELAAQGVQAARQAQPEALVAFGGGSPMDCAKAMRLCLPGGVPMWAVPTTAGTGSEMTRFAVLTDRAAGVKHPIVDDALLPDHAVLDPGLLEGVPPQVTADTGMDVLAHALESYVSSRASPFTDALAEKAAALAWQALPGAWRGEARAREDMLYASCLAGMAFNAASLGICHSLAHALGGRVHLPHGRLNALLLPHVVSYNAADSRAAARYSRLARLCGLAPNPRSLSAALNRLLTALKLPHALEVEDPAAVAADALGDVCTATNPRSPTQGELERILRALA
ncbi:MAG: iron-containing alcohol dehydrogenase [Oscillospiraceae bacterium]|nr:iron-containing alcohol dehydrogenase [Oscillospiraceae bacterium]